MRRALLCVVVALSACGGLGTHSPVSPPPSVSGVIQDVMGGSGLPSASVPGAVNPAVTQGDIATTICVSGWTANVRPPASYTTALRWQQRDSRCLCRRWRKTTASLSVLEGLPGTL